MSKRTFISTGRAIKMMMRGFPEILHSTVLHLFKNMNRKAESRLCVWYMKRETSEHVHFLVKVFSWVVLPVSLLYVCVGFCLLGKNAIASVLAAMLIFFYSAFLPDLPSIYGRKKSSKRTEDLPWYKKYALLLFAPIFVWALFSGVRLTWKTTENFHNFKSLTIYGGFLLLASFFMFADFPTSIGNIAKIVSLPLYGMVGYLIHLKVDKTW